MKKELDFLRGHEIYLKGGEFFYKDNDEPTVNNSRPNCGKCGGVFTEEDFDPCLGKLPGVMNACCGHGEPRTSYIMFENGTIVRGFDRIEN
jgi:hypothetical protein